MVHFFRLLILSLLIVSELFAQDNAVSVPAANQNLNPQSELAPLISPDIAPIVAVPDFNLAGLITTAIGNMEKTPYLSCSIISETVATVKSNKQYFEGMLKSIEIIKSMFRMKQILISSLKLDNNDCKDNAEATYNNLLSLENEIIIHLKGIKQLTFKHWTKNYGEESENVLNSYFLMGDVKEFKSGDVILTSNLVYKFDITRAVTPEDSLYSHAVMIYVDEITSEKFAITSEAFKGNFLMALDDFLKDNNYILTILRPIDQEAASLAANNFFAYLNSMTKSQRENNFDDMFNTDDKSKLYCAEVVDFAFKSTNKSFFNNSIISTIPLKKENIASVYLQRDILKVILPINLMFSKKFELVGEWKYFPGTRVNHLNYLIAKAVLDLPFKDLNVQFNYKYKILNFIWPYRNISFVKKILTMIGAPPQYLNSSKATPLFFGIKRSMVLILCQIESMGNDFKSFYGPKKIWIDDQVTLNNMTECLKSNFKKISDSD